MRITSAPASTNALMMAGSIEAGPIVAMILVWRTAYSLADCYRHREGETVARVFNGN
jgi:hypothetical protein